MRNRESQAPQAAPEQESVGMDIDKISADVLKEEAAEKSASAEAKPEQLSQMDQKMIRTRLQNLGNMRQKYGEWTDGGKAAPEIMKKLDAEMTELSRKLGDANPENPFADLTDAEINLAVDKSHFEDGEKYQLRQPAKKGFDRKPSAETEEAMADIAKMTRESEPEIELTDEDLKGNEVLPPTPKQARDNAKAEKNFYKVLDQIGDGKETDSAMAQVMKDIQPEQVTELTEDDIEIIPTPKGVAETPAERQFFNSEPNFNRMDEEGVIERNPQPSKLETPPPSLKHDETTMDLSRFGLTEEDLDKRAVSGWSKLKLGFRSLFNSELRQTIKQHDAALDAEAQIGAAVEKDTAALSKDKIQYEARKDVKHATSRKPNRPGAGPSGPGIMKF